MKRLFLLIGIVSTICSFSQNSEIISSRTAASNTYGNLRLSAGSSNGVWVKTSAAKKKVKGSYYLFNNWINNGSFYSSDKKSYKISRVNFNVKFNRFEANLSDFNNDSIFAFNSKTIEKVLIGNHEFVKKQVGGKGYNYFLELIQEGTEISLFKSYAAVIKEGTINPMTQKVIKEDRIDIKSIYYVEKNGVLNEVKLKKSAVLKLMSNKKEEIKEFLNDSKLSFKEDADVKKIFGYYNSII